MRPILRPEDDGKFVAIDVGTGDFEIDDDDYTAVVRLRTRSPRAEIWLGPRQGAGGLSDGAVVVIRGVVNARNEGIVSLRVRGPGGSELDVDAVVDSGFTASLALPAPTVAALGLVRSRAAGRCWPTARSGSSTSMPRR